jgi:hypothetical protein
MQDEIAKASGVISKNNKNMTPGKIEIYKKTFFLISNKKTLKDEIKCQSELVDLMPAVEEANSISIALDKKVLFSILPVSAAAR